ncbi:MAG: hypothetical protein RR234_10675, partial [Christensenella sp.]
LVQKLPEMVQLNKEVSALQQLWSGDNAVVNIRPSDVTMRLSSLDVALETATTQQKAMMQEHGINAKGESIHAGNDIDRENYFLLENARQDVINKEKNHQITEKKKAAPRAYKEQQAEAKAKWHEQGGDNEFTERFAAEQKKRAQGA